MDSRLHCFIWDVCASLLIPYPVVSPGWRRRFMELWESAEQPHCRVYFPVGALGTCRILGNGFAMLRSVSHYLELAHCAFTKSQPLDEPVALSVTRSGAPLSRLQHYMPRQILGSLRCV